MLVHDQPVVPSLLEDQRDPRGAKLPAAPALADLDGRELVLFDRRANPDLYDDVAARLAAAAPRAAVEGAEGRKACKSADL